MRNPPIATMLVSLLLAAACGEEASTATVETSAATAPDNVAPPEVQAPPLTPSARMIGTWHLSIPNTIPHLPEAQRHPVRLVWLAFRPEPPTDEELEAEDFGSAERLGMFMMRRKQTTDPDDAALVRARDGLATMQGVTLEFTAEAITLVTPDEREVNTYQLVSETADTLVINTTDPEGEIDRVEIVFAGADQITVSVVDQEPAADEAAAPTAAAAAEAEEASDEPEVMAFVRQGSAASQAEQLGARPEVPPTGVPAPAGLLGRWDAEGRRDGLEFFADGRYVLHGLGGDIEGEYRVLRAAGNSLTVRTRLSEFPWAMGDTIEIDLSADQIGWHNTGTDARSTYLRHPA